MTEEKNFALTTPTHSFNLRRVVTGRSIERENVPELFEFTRNRRKTGTDFGIEPLIERFDQLGIMSDEGRSLLQFSLKTFKTNTQKCLVVAKRLVNDYNLLEIMEDKVSNFICIIYIYY